jgi:hypothetical protein
LVGGGWALSASFSAARSLVPGFENTYSVGGGLTRLGSRGAFAVNATIGLTETAPDLTIAVSWRVAVAGARP